MLSTLMLSTSSGCLNSFPSNRGLAARSPGNSGPALDGRSKIRERDFGVRRPDRPVGPGRSNVLSGHDFRGQHARWYLIRESAAGRSLKTGKRRPRFDDAAFQRKDSR
jgi:hypothetical protein